MLLECSCGKMYRVKDDTVNPPTKCPACGGTLRASGGGPSAGGKELESKLQASERERASLKSRVGGLEHELREAQAALKKKDQEIEENKRKIAELEGGGGTKGRGPQAPAQTMALLKAKDDALQEARERLAALEEEMSGKGGGGSSERVAQLESDLAEAQASISRLGTDLEKAQNAYKEALQKKDDDLEEKQQKLAALEKQAASAGSRTPAPAGSELQRAQARISQLERIVQDGEQRYRTLQEKMDALEQGGSAGAKEQADALAEKDKLIAKLREDVSGEQARAGELQKQLQEARRVTKARPKEEPAPPPAPPALPARLGEARYLAADLDKSLGSVGSSLQALVERVKRLNESLQGMEVVLPAGAVPGAPVWGKAPEEPASASPPPAEPLVEDVHTLESLPAPAAPEDDGLPADETLLDMGKMGHKVRAAARREPEETYEPPEGLEEPSSQPMDEVPLSAETSPGPVPEEGEAEPEPGSEPMPPKKKGLFGKLFGKKK